MTNKKINKNPVKDNEVYELINDMLKGDTRVELQVDVNDLIDQGARIMGLPHRKTYTWRDAFCVGGWAGFAGSMTYILQGLF